MSVKETTIKIMFEEGMIQWVIKLLERSRHMEINKFCLDFSTALLANILHSENTLEHLERSPKLTKDIMVSSLSFLKEKIPTSVLMHILISLSYLSKERLLSYPIRDSIPR